MGKHKSIMLSDENKTPFNIFIEISSKQINKSHYKMYVLHIAANKKASSGC